MQAFFFAMLNLYLFVIYNIFTDIRSESPVHRPARRQ
jgi:hypothetical protein